MNQLIVKAFASPSQSIREVIQVIDQASIRAAIIVDENRKLLGLITDGDIRRAILQEVDLSLPVTAIIKHLPMSCTSGESLASVKSLMLRKKLLHMPIVDDGVLVDVITINDVDSKPQIDNPVFIMAGGFGTRLRPLTNDCPKPMLKIGGKPLLETIIARFIEQGFHQFYISTHYKGEMIKNHFGDGSTKGVNIAYIDEDQPLGTAGALGLLPPLPHDLPTVVINGDILAQVDFKKLLDYHKENKGVATMCVRQHEYQVPYGVIETDGKIITSITEKPSYSFFVNSGVYVLEPSLIQRIERNESIDMPTLLQAEMDAGKDVAMYPLYEYWLDIGKMQDFKRAQQEYASIFELEMNSAQV